LRKIVTEDEFEALAGKLIPIQRNTKIFDNDKFDCCCGRTHVFRSGITNVTHEGQNGRFLLLCDASGGEVYMVLIKTKMKFGFFYQGFDLLGGLSLNDSDEPEPLPKMKVESDLMPESDMGVREGVTQSNEANDAGFRSRLLEVAGWGWRAFAVCLAILVLVGSLFQYLEQNRLEDALILLTAYAASALIFNLVVWLMIYISQGGKAHFFKLLNRVAFGNMPFYFWFVLGVLYFGGLFSALWHDTSDSAVRWMHFSSGLGSAFAALLLGSPFWFFTPKKWSHVGHMVGTILMGSLMLIVPAYLL